MSFVSDSSGQSQPPSDYDERLPEAETEPSATQLESIAQAAKVLASTSAQEALDRLTRLAVSAYADFCVIAVPNEHQLQLVAAAHVDPAKDVFAQLLRGPVPIVSEGGSPITEAFRRHSPVVVADLDPHSVLEWFGDERYAQIAEGIGLRAVTAIPLESRASIIGVMIMGFSQDPAGPSSPDLEAIRPFTDLVAVTVQQLIDTTRLAELTAACGRRWHPLGQDRPKSQRTPIRVLLVDPLTVVREGVRLLIEQNEGMSVCAEVAGLGDLLDLDCDPDIIVTELLLNDASGPQVVHKLADRFPEAHVVVLSRVSQPIYLHLALAAGAKGYLSKDSTPVEVIDAVTAVARGDEYLQPALGPALARWQYTRASGKLTSLDLTRRERDVLDLVAQGHTNVEVADMLGVSLRTVETHRSHLSRKLGLRTRADLVEAARDLQANPSLPSPPS